MVELDWTVIWHGMPEHHNYRWSKIQTLLKPLYPFKTQGIPDKHNRGPRGSLLEFSIDRKLCFRLLAKSTCSWSASSFHPRFHFISLISKGFSYPICHSEYNTHYNMQVKQHSLEMPQPLQKPQMAPKQQLWLDTQPIVALSALAHSQKNSNCLSILLLPAPQPQIIHKPQPWSWEHFCVCTW